MAIVFPASPSVNDTFTVGSITYKCVQNNPTKWIGLGVTPADRLVEGSNSLEITAGNDLVWTGDNVGIGTDNPNHKLTLFQSGTGTFDAINVVTGNTNSTGYQMGVNSSGDVFHWNTTNSSINFATNNTERLRITSDGQVSISSDGTADGLLTIKGNSDATGTPSIRLLDGSDTREVSISNTSGDFVATVHGTDNAAHGQIKMFESGIFTVANGGASGSNTERLRVHTDGAVTKPHNPLIRTVMSDVYGASQSLTSSPPSAIVTASASISRGTNGFSTTGSNAYTFVCPVAGVYAVFAHISLGNVTEPDGTREAGDRTIWTMGYTLGGGNLPLANYVEIIDTNVFDFENASYYGVWDFTAGTRVGCGLNSGNGTASGLAMEWGIHLIQ